jgi:hypothetical protein
MDTDKEGATLAAQKARKIKFNLLKPSGNSTYHQV